MSRKCVEASACRVWIYLQAGDKIKIDKDRSQREQAGYPECSEPVRCIRLRGSTSSKLDAILATVSMNRFERDPCILRNLGPGANRLRKVDIEAK